MNCTIFSINFQVLVWQVFAKMFMKSIDQLPIMMQRLSFKRSTVLEPNTDIKLYINILSQTGDFEIFESGSLVVTGNIKVLKDKIKINNKTNEENFDSLILNENDFYKECNLRKLFYGNEFRGVIKFDLKMKKANVHWFEKFDCFLDNLMQIILLTDFHSRDLFLPTFIEKLMIDTPLFLEKVIKHKGKT